MAKNKNVEKYISDHSRWGEGLKLLRDFLTKFPLQETIKWGAPVYTYKDKNCIGLAAFKNHYALWLFHGSLLKDNIQLLQNAQEGKTQSLRQIRFSDSTPPDVSLLKPYVIELMNVMDNETPPKTKPKKLILTKEFKELFEIQPDLEKDFVALSPGKQKEYVSYIAEAKRESTRKARLEKILPLLKERKGLNDKYKNC
ncbi:MAG TPA: DUF1801 domain-containing protein [Gillisia sp.]|nr:DUF1801 domain-containing protein [Gillisia sp.]